MVYLIIALIVALNVSQFLMPFLDIWHATGVGAQVLILLIFSYSFFDNQKFCEPRNIGIGLIHLWLGIQTAFICYHAQTQGKYEIQRFFPYFNVLCLLILYKSIVQYLNRQNIRWVYQALRVSIIVTVVVCLLQFFGLSQVFKLFKPEDKYYNNLVVGFIGNGTHLSGFLGMCVPLFLYKIKGWNSVIIVLLGIILCFMTGSGKGDVAISGIAVALISVISYYYMTNRRVFVWLLLAVFIGSVFAVIYKNSDLMNFHGRDAMWDYYWRASRKNFISGIGVGSLNMIYTKTPYPEARHVHLEYLQMLFEGGFILICCFVYFLKEFFVKKGNELGAVFKSMCIGFLASCFFNYPMHLWLSSTYACIAYSCLIAFNERSTYDSNTKTN